MSYYILPKNHNIITVNPHCSNETPKNYLTPSLERFYDQIKNQIEYLFEHNNDLSNNTFEQAITMVNPYEFIFSKVPGSKFSVSKLKPKTNIFYDLFEILNNINIIEMLKKDKNIQLIHISPNYEDSIKCFDICRDGYNDIHNYYENIDNIETKFEDKFDFIFYETKLENYFYSFIQALILILYNQNYKGNCVIKIGHIFHKSVIDILYFLSSIYDKVYICKPNTNNITTFEKYIVCKNFQLNELSVSYITNNCNRLISFLKNLDNKHIHSVLDFKLPYYFKNKIDDLNIIIGQQQLEALEQIINIYQNKNKNDKIENLKKNNIQKSVLWCEKYNIPFNKFAEKINIFYQL
jgi:hypothetical protein